MSAPGHERRESGISPLFSMTIITLAILYVAYDTVWGLPPRANDYAIGRDFVNMWTGARFALSGDISTLFDWPLYVASQRAAFWPELAIHNWSYPPHVLLFTWPLGFFPYPVALALWDILGLTALFLAIRLALRTVEPPQRLWLTVAAMGAPVVAYNIVLGQFGLFIGALCITAWTLRKERPIIAGLLIGILTIKPHLGLLWPVLLLLERRFTVLASAAATTVALVVATSLIFGWSVFPDYLAYAAPTQSMILVNTDLLAVNPTPMMIARAFGLPAEAGIWFIAAVAPIAFAAFLYVQWAKVEDTVKFAMFGATTFLILPYAFTYDSTILIVPLVLLLERASQTGPRLILMACYFLPLLGMASPPLHVPLAVVGLMALAVLLVTVSRPLSRDRCREPASVARVPDPLA